MCAVCNPSANIALLQPAWSSSVWTADSPAPGLVASFAVDGNLYNGVSYGINPKCAASSGATNEWLAVDLGSYVTVAGVKVTYRGDCCRKCPTTQLT